MDIKRFKIRLWGDVKGYEGVYRISLDGLVKSKERKVPHNGKSITVKEKLLTQRVDRAGYHTVRLSKDGNTITYYVHRLIGEAYFPNCNNLPCINHKNGNKLDNTVSNIEWTTHSDNMKHAYRIGLIRRNSP